MATLGANLPHLGQFTNPRPTEEITNLPNYKLLEKAFEFKHVYLPDDDLAVFVNYFCDTLKVEPNMAVALVFIVFGVSELKYRTESKNIMISPMCNYMHGKIGKILPSLEGLAPDRYWLRPNEDDKNPLELIKRQIDPAKAVFYSLTRYRVAEAQINEKAGKKELCNVYKVPATMAIDTLSRSPSDEEVSLALGWGLISLWLMGDGDCPEQPYWFSPVFRQVMANGMEQELRSISCLQGSGILSPTFFSDIADKLGLLVEHAEALKSGLYHGLQRSRSRSHTPTGDGSLRPGTPYRDGFITPGEENELPRDNAVRAVKNFLVSAKSRLGAWNQIPSDLQRFILNLGQNEFALGCDFIAFDDE